MVIPEAALSLLPLSLSLAAIADSNSPPPELEASEAEASLGLLADASPLALASAVVASVLAAALTEALPELGAALSGELAAASPCANALGEKQNVNSAEAPREANAPQERLPRRGERCGQQLGMVADS